MAVSENISRPARARFSWKWLEEFKIPFKFFSIFPTH